MSLEQNGIFNIGQFYISKYPFLHEHGKSSVQVNTVVFILCLFRSYSFCLRFN